LRDPREGVKGRRDMGRPPKVSVDREREILRLHERDGWSLRGIARKFELTDRGVAKIVERATARGDSGWWKTGSAQLDEIVTQAVAIVDPKGTKVEVGKFLVWLRAGKDAGYLDVLFQLGRDS
jgi:hypothetical protein